jgi:hypothetical protein
VGPLARESLCIKNVILNYGVPALYLTIISCHIRISQSAYLKIIAVSSGNYTKHIGLNSFFGQNTVFMIVTIDGIPM